MKSEQKTVNNDVRFFTNEKRTVYGKPQFKKESTYLFPFTETVSSFAIAFVINYDNNTNTGISGTKIMKFPKNRTVYRNMSFFHRNWWTTDYESRQW